LIQLNRSPFLLLVAAGGLSAALSAPAPAQAGDASPVAAKASEGSEPIAAGGLQGPFGKKGGGAAKEEAAKAPAAAPEPNQDLRARLQCIDDFKPTDVQGGVVRDYDVTEGMSVSQRTGFLDRKPQEMTNGCFLGELQPPSCFAFTVDSEKYAALGNSNDWELQCVYSDDPAAGMITNKEEYPYSVDRMPGNQMMLLCGHGEGDAYECDGGSNSGRSGVWKEKLEKEGKEQLGFCVNEYVKQSVVYDTAAYPGGRWVYCQYYNKQSKKNLFGYEFLQKTR
jgi:hypothetical protein